MRKRRGNLLPSFVNLRKQILAVGSHRPHFCFPVSYILETAISAWGYILLRCVKRRGNLFAVVRICVSKFCRRLPSPALLLSCRLHMGNGNFRMGLRTSSVRETTRQLVAVIRICVSKFCRSSPFDGSRENPKRHANGNGNFRMGLYYLVARNDAATCLPSFVFAQANSCRSSPFYGSRENPKRHANGNGNFRMGLYYFVARKRRGNFIFI